VKESGRKVGHQPIEHNIHDLESKPSFYMMVKRALLANKMHYLRGVSMNQICKYVAENWPVDLKTYRRLTRVAVKRALDAGKLELVGAVGITYRLAPSEQPIHVNKKQKNDGVKKDIISSTRGKTGGDMRNPELIYRVDVRHGWHIDQLSTNHSKPVGGNGGDVSFFQLAEDDCIVHIRATMGGFLNSLTFTSRKGKTFGPYGGKGPQGVAREFKAPEGKAWVAWKTCGVSYPPMVVLYDFEPHWGPILVPKISQ
jgi:hypothetical protein